MLVRNSIIEIALIGMLTACGSSEPKPTVPVAQVPSAPTAVAVNPKPDDDATRGSIHVSPEIKKACVLSDYEAFFAFDSANVRPEDKTVLRKLVDCFVTGPLKGRRMSLVGHADPRGTAEYNLALGGRRADSVKTIIVAENMPIDMVSTTSRGEMDATGTDEESWAKDRFVDVVLGQENP
jgi:peptidoglycan-associated lipoprotein